MLKATSRRLREAGFTGPAVLVLEEQARRNIRAMAERATAAGVRFRPHFKTHQSAAVGAWFADEGITAITVSSLEMAEYFARHGWNDITLAFLLNPLLWPRLEDLALDLAGRGGRLGITLDSLPVARQVAERADLPLDVWIKIDTGYGRTGLRWDDTPNLRTVHDTLADTAGLRGLLTHSGHAYAAVDDAGRRAIWRETLERLEAVRHGLGSELEISVGDTPCCRTVERLDGPDEIRPGNFIFFDLMQWSRGVCRTDELAAAIVCPVVGLYPQEGRIVLQGGAVHLSREGLPVADGPPVFGMVGRLDPAPEVLREMAVTSLSQEHGIIQLTAAEFERLAGDLGIGDLLLVWPVHSCLSCNLAPGYWTMGGDFLPHVTAS